jgi:hypothetical protein
MLGGNGRRLFEMAVLADQQVFQCLAQISQDMEAVRHLHGLWCSPPASIGVAPSAIPAQHFHSWMLQQPRRKGVGCPVREHIHPDMALQIDQQGAVLAAATEGKVIDAQHPRRPSLQEAYADPDDPGSELEVYQPEPETVALFEKIRRELEARRRDKAD